MKQEADEITAATVAVEGLPPEADGQPYSDAIAIVYGLLSEFTHANQPALTLFVLDPDWVLQPPRPHFRRTSVSRSRQLEGLAPR